MGELIDRQETLDALDKRFESLLRRFDYNSYENADEKTKLVCDGLSEAEDVVMGLPSAQPKRGKWIKTARWGRVYYCDQCRNYLDFDGVNAGRGSTNFCPNCGAKMEGEQDG